jgi:adenosylcobyric acid synthase
MNGAVLVAGTASDAGKSVLVAGLCRWLRRQGVRVAPFKAQNMSNNAAVTAEGREIGRAQAAQAAAAGAEPEAAMNPILLKPTGERTSQVVVMGRPWTDSDAVGYPELKERLLPVVLGALEDLRSRFDVVVCEGAGGVAEINLRAADLANLGLARAADMPVVIVGDIDRGGVFASLFGSLALLEPADQALVRAFVVNKFRGDPALLRPGLERLRELTGRPVLGVVPWVPSLGTGLGIDAEDSLALEGLEGRALDGDPLTVAVVRLPRIANFTDVDPLAAEPGVEVRFTASTADLEHADLVVVPGTKATVTDLDWLRGRGLDRVLVERARQGRPVVGICGGYQMLGRCVVDAVESGAGTVDGLGLLPVSTVFERDKVLARSQGCAPFFDGAGVEGYEIHHGRPRVDGGEPVMRTGAGEGEGCRVGAVVGTSWHGLFESDAFRRAFFSWVASCSRREWVAGARPFAEVREARLDALGDLVELHLDTSALAAIIQGGSEAGLPVVEPRLLG